MGVASGAKMWTGGWARHPVEEMGIYEWGGMARPMHAQVSEHLKQN